MPYLGQRPSKGDENNFKILDDISSYTLTFDGSDSSVVSAANDTITSLTHRFVQGQRVTYNKGGGTVITGLSDGVYYIIKHDHNTIKLATSASNAANGIAVNITNVGSGSSHTLNVAFDGVNTKFKATHTNGQKAKITRSAQLVISINGVIQQPHDSATPSTGFGFDLDGTIVFSQAPVAGDVYWAHVLTNNNVTFDISDNDVDNFTGDGSTVSFNLSKIPPDNRNVLVTIDGVVQYPNDPDGTVRAYTVVENVLTFTVAPAADVQIQVRHIGFAGSTSGGGGVTNFYGRTGSVTLINTDNIVANNAEFAGNLTVQGTMTTLDTKVTEVDQLEVAANNTTVGVAITQSGTGDIVNLFDGATEVLTIKDSGIVGINSTTPDSQFLVDAVGKGIFTTDDTISSNDFNKGQFTVRNRAASQGAFLDFRATSGNGIGRGVIAKIGGFNTFSGTGYDGALTFSTRQNSDNTMVERFRLTSTGLLNIGDADHLDEEYLGSTLKIQKDQNSVTRLVMRNQDSGSGSASAVQIGASGNSWMLQCGSAANDSNAFTIRVDGTSNSNTGTEKLRLDTSGRLLLGTTTEGHADADDFTIGTSTNSAGITIRTNTSGTGRLFFSDGTSGAAEYQGYIQYDHGNERLSLGSGGATRLNILHNGRVGVGTDDVQTQFQVGVSGELSAGDINRRFVGIKMANSIGVIRSTFYSGKSGTYAPLQIHVRDGIVMHFDADTNRYIGIGNTTPTAKLDVTGTVKATNFVGALPISNDSNNRVITATGSGGLNAESTLTYGGNGVLNIKGASGNTQLALLRTNANTTGTAGIVGFYASDGHAIASMYALGDGDNEGAHLVFNTTTAASGSNPYSDVSERLRITSGGNIEVSTTTNTNPTYIRVNSNRSNADDALGGIHGLWNGNPITGINFKTGADTTNKDDGRIQFVTYGGGTAGERMIIREDGNIGINETAPSEKLQIDGDILLGGQANSSESNYAIKFEYNQHQFAKIVGDGRDSSGYGDIDFYTSSGSGVSNLTQRMSIRADGKVLIGDGTSITPSRNLDVRGTGQQQILIGSTNNSGASIIFDGHGGGDGSGGNYGAVEMGSDGHFDIRNYDPAKNIVFGVGSNVGGNDSVVINSSGQLLVSTSTLGHGNADDLTIATAGGTLDHTGITIRSATNRNGSVFFADGTSGADRYRGWVQYTHSDGTNSNYLTFGTNADERVRITSDGDVNIGGNLTQTLRKLSVQSAAEQVASFEYTGSGADGCEVRFMNNSSSPAVDDILGYLQFSGKDSTAAETMYSAIITRSSNVTNTQESGNISFYTRNNGSFGEKIRILEDGTLSNRVAGSSSAWFSRPILAITGSSTPSQLKIKTNIPYSGFSHAESVTIRGFRYGGRDTVDLQICWHVYAGQFYNRIASSSGGWAPLITLAVENGKVVIHFDSLGYWFKLYVADYYSPQSNNVNYAKGWTYDHTAVNGDSGTPVNTVPYKNDWGGLEYNSDHGVGTNPDRHLNIKNGNLIIGTTGHGIDFSATGNSSNNGTNNELFDDYEEGSWNAASLNYDYDGNQAQRGFYVKIGRMVYAYYRVKFHNQSTYTGQHMRWTQLPFTADSGNPQDVIVGAHAHAYGSIDFFRVYVQPGSTYAYWYSSTGSNFNNSTSMNSADVRGCIMYKASA